MQFPWRRRRFLKTSAAAALSWGAAAAHHGARPAEAAEAAIREPARDTPVAGESEVVVCGAGPAGVAAAITAARTGARTQLVEANGCLGGVWTAGLLSMILDYANKPGLMQELRARLEARGAALAYDRGHLAYNAEPMKLLLEDMCREAGVNVRLHTSVAATVVDDAGRLRAAITESKSGREAFRATTFIDATGDGDLAARAGCGFDYGHEETGLGQPMSLIALLTGVDPEQIARFTRGLAEPRGEPRPKQRLLEELRRAGVSPSYSAPTLFFLPGKTMCAMINHEYRVKGVNANDLTDATIRARAEVNRLISSLRELGGVWKDVEIVSTAEHIGVREGRRIHGVYRVTTDDLTRGARHEDAVCRVEFGVDVHSPDPKKSRGFDHGNVRARAYDIPYRALLPRDVHGLLVAGRCISGDFVAHSSYRVTGNAVATGEAAGAAAALAARQETTPAQIAWPQIAATLVQTRSATETSGSR